MGSAEEWSGKLLGRAELCPKGQSPTQDDHGKLKHTTHDLEGAVKCRVPTRPSVTTNCGDIFDVTTFADSDWPGWTTARKSRTRLCCHHARRAYSQLRVDAVDGCIVTKRRRTVLFEIWHGETMGVPQFLRECNIKTNGCATMSMDPTAGKSMALKFGVSRATKHIQLRFLCTQDLASAGVVRWGGVLLSHGVLTPSTDSGV